VVAHTPQWRYTWPSFGDLGGEWEGHSRKMAQHPSSKFIVPVKGGIP